MEAKNVQQVKTRLIEIERQHNRLTSIVVSLIGENEKLKKRLKVLETTNNSQNKLEEIDNMIINSSSESDSRANKIIEELRKVQMS